MFTFNLAKSSCLICVTRESRINLSTMGRKGGRVAVWRLVRREIDAWSKVQIVHNEAVPNITTVSEIEVPNSLFHTESTFLNKKNTLLVLNPPRVTLKTDQIRYGG